MTSRERFLETVRFGSPDRTPLFEDGLRDDVLESWSHQGCSTTDELAVRFAHDRCERIELKLEPAAPHHRSPRSREDLRGLGAALDPSDRTRRADDWPAKVREWRGREYILDMCIHHGLFRSMGVGDWASLEPLLYLLATDPDFVRNVMDIRAEFAAGLADVVLRDAEVDMVTFYEPIGSNHAPLISPDMYRRVVLESYAPIIDVLHRHGVPAIVFVVYANGRILLRDVVDAGFNCLRAMEAETRAMDYASIRHEYGRKLCLIGGIDVDALLGTPGDVRRHIRDAVPSLLEQGGYVPLADGRIRAAVPYDNYCIYRSLLEEYADGSS